MLLLQNVVNAYRADCACVLDNGDGTWNVWHTGATDGTCATCAYNYANVTQCTGKHTYGPTDVAGKGYYKTFTLDAVRLADLAGAWDTKMIVLRISYNEGFLAGTLMWLLERPEILAQAKKEHFEKTGGEYICPIPADLLPDTPENLGKHNI